MVEQRIKQDLIDDIKELLTDYDNEIDLIDNDFGFKTAYIKDGNVRWDYVNPNDAFWGKYPTMGEITTLSALRDTIIETIDELDFQSNLVNCTIRWKDDGNTLDVTIKLSSDVGDDDDIFFYCNSYNDLMGLMDEDNGEDFVVTKINS